jgi:hypothetical protein
MKKPDWLCNLCWDNRRTEIHGTTSTTPAIDHLAEYYKINKDGPIPQQLSVFEAEKEENNPTMGCVF